MVTLRVILKSGQEFSVKCEKYSVNQTEDGMINGLAFEEIVENYPAYIDVSQIVAIIHEMSDEPACVVRGSDEAASVEV